MLKVEVLSFEKLSQKEQDDMGRRSEYAQFIRVTHNDEIILFRSDRMEPEDVAFCRSLKWVPVAIKEAYELGLRDARVV